jgi:plastocyanin
MRFMPFLASLTLLAAAPASAQEWRPAPEYDVLLTPYDIAPAEIRLPADRPVRLRFVNTSNQGLTFSAGRFFRASKNRTRDGEWVQGGRVSVPALSTRTVVVVPKAGRYKVKGGTMFHKLLGMKGRIVVE